jgi:uncharacterized protein (DUF58 family)
MPSLEPAPSEPRFGLTEVRLGPAAGLILLGALLLVAGRAFAAVPLFVVGVGFLVLGVLAPAWVLAAGRGATLRRRITVHRAIEDEPLEATIVIHRGWLGLPGAQLHDPLAHSTIEVAEPLSVLAGRSRVQLRVVARIPRRGRHSFPPPRVTLSDSLGLARVLRIGTGGPDELLVLPRTEPVHWLRRQHRQMAIGHARPSANEPMGAGEVDGLRQYMPGTPASRIHWPALARYPDPPALMERRLVAEFQTLPLIVLDSRCRVGGSDPALLDAVVRATGSLTLELARAGGCQVLLPGDRRATPVGRDLGAWPALHTRLALVEEEPDPSRAPILRRGVARGPVIFLSVRLDTQAALSGAGLHATQLILVVPRRVGGRLQLPASFEVAGCTGFVLPSATRNLRRGVAA